MTTLFDVSGISARIFTLPNRPPFMLAADLAEVYGTSVKALNQAVSRNPERFPEDFMFSLTDAETEALRSQNVTANTISTKVRYEPKVFTHAGAYALSAVLKTPTAAAVSVLVHRAFAAMEQRTLLELRHLLARVQSDARGRRPIRSRIVDAVREGWTFEQLWRDGNLSRVKLTAAIRDCLMLGLIERVPEGTVFVVEVPVVTPETDPRQMAMNWDD